MRKSLTRADILRRRCEIAELFPKKSVRKRGKSPKIQRDAKEDFPGSLVSAAPFDNAVDTAVRLSQLEAEEIFLALHSSAEKTSSPAVLLRCSTGEAGLRLCVATHYNGPDKVFISPARRLGGAVVRNRAKRLQREFYRHSRDLLRMISCQASEWAICRLCGDLLSHTGVSVSKQILFAAWEKFEQKLSYHWGLIILNLAPEISHSAAEILVLERFWSLCHEGHHKYHKADFGRELGRYQRLLAKLERSLQQKWLVYLEHTLLKYG